MAGCNCKSKGNKGIDALNNTNAPKEKLGPMIITYALKIVGFLILIAALPIINLFIIWFMFKTLVLNKEVNMKPLLLAIGSKFKEKNEDEEVEDYDSLTEEDVEMVDVEIITNTSK